jgi:hypothetical protein
VHYLPLDYFRLPLEPFQALYLLVAYVALALPFFMAGLLIAAAYAAHAHQSGRVYFATMLGSACGALAVIPGLPVLGETRLLVVMALLPLMLLPWPVSARQAAWSSRVTALVLALVTAMGAMWAWRLPIAPSPYKALSQQLRFPGTRIVDTRHDIRGRIDLLESPYLRFAPGLSLKYTARLPAQAALYSDGDDPMALYDVSNPRRLNFAAHTLPFMGYHLHGAPRRALILARGGGTAMACALAAGSSDITIVTPHPQVALALARHYHLDVTAAAPRAYLARTRQRFDLIHIDDWGQSLPGSGALRQSHAFTIEALQDYWDHLHPTGVVVMARKLLLPPSDAIRLWATAYTALRNRGVSDPENHLLMMRNWDLYTLVISAAPIAQDAEVAAFAHAHNFDLLFQAGGDATLINRYNQFEQPLHATEIARLAEAYGNGRAEAFFDAYPLDVRPQSDRRPFPYRILKWHRLDDLYRSLGKRLYALVMSGEIVVVVVLLEALVVSMALMALPFKMTRRAGAATPLAVGLYFLCVGVGFMLMELYYIKQLMLLFEDPVIAFAVVVVAILVFSALSGLYAQHCSAGAHRLCLMILCGAIAATAMFPTHFWLWLAALPAPIGLGVSLLMLLPVGLLMGIPFPVGMRRFVNHPAQSATAWALNGCASVVAAIAAAQIALIAGLPYLLAGAAMAYLLAFGCAYVCGLDRIEAHT